MQAENSITGISHEDNVPMHLQHLQELKPLKKSGRSRPATAVEERLHRSVKQEIAALEREIQAEVDKRNKLEKKLKKTIAVSRELELGRSGISCIELHVLWVFLLLRPFGRRSGFDRNGHCSSCVVLVPHVI